MGNDIMKILVGNDIIEVDRIKRAAENINFLSRVFTDNEIEYCESKGNKTKYQHYAARFAGKEAVYKAISPILEDKYQIGWKNIEIINDKKGRPIVVFNEVNFNYNEVDISLSHIKDYAMATAVVVINKKQGD